MSLHLPASRRKFLQMGVGTGLLTLASETASAEATGSKEHVAGTVESHQADDVSVDPNSWVFFADTHVSGDKTKIVFDANMFANLSRAIDEVIELSPRPAGVFINGDCAYLKGLPEDYRVFATEVQRLIDAGVNVHMTMGNHDDRTEFANALQQETSGSPVEGKLVSIVQSETVNWFLVDSLQVVNKVTGEIGEAQREWLTTALKQHDDKPAIVLGHHNPQYLPEPEPDAPTPQVTGLVDTAELVDVFHSHPHVKAYVYGHTHHWNLKQTAGKVHLVNLPPVAYLFDKSHPNGWVHARVSQNEMTLTMKAFDHRHKDHSSDTILRFR